MKLTVQQHAMLAKEAAEALADAAATLALDAELASVCARTPGPLADRIEAAVRKVGTRQDPVAVRALASWREAEAIYGIILLSLMAFCQHRAGAAAKRGKAIGFRTSEEDLLGVALVGAMRGIRRFNPYHPEEIQLPTYVKSWVTKALGDEINRMAGLFALPGAVAASQDNTDGLSEQRVAETDVFRITRQEARGRIRDHQHHELADRDLCDRSDGSHSGKDAAESIEKSQRARIIKDAIDRLREDDAQAATAVEVEMGLRSGLRKLPKEALERGLRYLAVELEEYGPSRTPRGAHVG